MNHVHSLKDDSVERRSIKTSICNYRIVKEVKIETVIIILSRTFITSLSTTSSYAKKQILFF